jgi:hypothetical protein
VGHEAVVAMMNRIATIQLDERVAVSLSAIDIFEEIIVENELPGRLTGSLKNVEIRKGEVSENLSCNGRKQTVERECLG